MVSEDAFRSVVEPHRAALQAHCYRMLGSLHDAEDALQETLLRAWRGFDRYDGDRPLRPWLYRIATTACLDALAKRPKRVLPLDHGPASRPDAGPGRPLTDVDWLEPFPDRGIADGYGAPDARYEQRESVELAFIAALQHLPATQRAVLILREVLGFSAREVAQSLDSTTASVNSALQRARRRLDQRLPERSQQATLRSLGDDGVRAAVERFVEAWDSRNIDSLRALLVEDATFATPPHPNWFRGRDAVIAFITSVPDLPRRCVRTTANGQPAVGWYILNPARDRFLPASLEVLALEGDRVRDITAFLGREIFDTFGLPRELPNQRGQPH
jgi:RNA polymerase sigma-70 factor, ECF subfamily